MKKLTPLFLLGSLMMASPAQAELTGFYEDVKKATPISKALASKVGTTSPNFIAIALKNQKEIGLSEKQKAQISLWIEANSKTMKRLMHKTIVLEKSAVSRSLRGTRKDVLISKIDKANALRKEIAIRKIECRDHLRSTLTAAQWGKIVDIYKADHKQHAALTH